METPIEQKPKINHSLKTFLITLVLVAALVLTYWIVAKGNNGKKITLDVFYSQLENGKIESVELDSKTVDIVYKNGSRACLFQNFG